MKIRILVAYDEMMMGGSTTSLISLLNVLDPDKYEIDLQLYRNKGPLLDQIPSHVNLLPAAFMHEGRVGKIVKIAKGIVSGALLKARLEKKRLNKRGYSGQVLSEFRAKWLSKKSSKQYDIAIGYLEGWSDRYVAFCVKARKKFGWLHSTFANISEVPRLERAWMDCVDHVVLVADNCKDDFNRAMPDYAHKSITVNNIVDSLTLRKRAEQIDVEDGAYMRFAKANCFRIVTVCRTTIATKGLDRALECAVKLKRIGKEFLWVFVGDGEDFQKFNLMIAEKDLSDCVEAVGNRLNPLPFINAADVFCMLSRYEGKPMVVTESMILGTPPIVTRYLSACEQIESTVDGIVVENEDDSALSAILKCMDDPETVGRMKENLAHRDYGNASYVKEIEKLYFCNFKTSEGNTYD